MVALKRCFVFAFLVLISFFPSQQLFAEEGFLNTSDGVKLFYEYFKASPQKGAVVLLHGSGMSYNEWADLREFLNQNGWSTIAIDFRGHGASREQGKRQLDFDSFSQDDILKMRNIDIPTATHFFKDTRPIWLIGSSFGAALGFSYATEKKGIRGVVLLSPTLDYPERRYQAEMTQYGNRPILVVASEDDPKPFDSAAKLRKYAQGKAKFIRYKAKGHGTRMLAADKDLKNDILQWLDQNS